MAPPARARARRSRARAQQFPKHPDACGGRRERRLAAAERRSRRLERRATVRQPASKDAVLTDSAMDGLDTTNVLLGIMAAVSVLEALLLIGAGVGIFLVYRRVMTLVNELEQRQVAPAMARVNAILDDVKIV